ncbi:MAG TPA: hypothetical protein VGL25_08130 [Casimicrobiaceae bacterium]|jgi:hypothetical protein
MERRTLLYVVLACFALTSCAPMQRIDTTAPTSQECRGATCDVDVLVSGNDIVVVDYVIVKQPVSIRWNLPNGSPYTIKIDIIGGGSVFRCMANGQRQYVCIDNKEGGVKVYKYSVKLSGPNNLEKDPYIVND